MRFLGASDIISVEKAIPCSWALAGQEVILYLIFFQGSEMTCWEVDYWAQAFHTSPVTSPTCRVLITL